MPKLRVNKGSGKQKDYITNYTISIACSILKQSGLLPTDELSVLTDREGRIIIQKAVKIQIEKETETMNIELAIEHLQEMGKVCVDNVKHVKALQVELQNRGYSTQRINTDRDYLVLDN